jgi:enoyl-CoA hydratase
MKYEILEGGIAKISLDNGKACTVSIDLPQEFIDNLDHDKTESKCVLISGHASTFSLEFDLRL